MMECFPPFTASTMRLILRLINTAIEFEWNIHAIEITSPTLL